MRSTECPSSFRSTGRMLSEGFSDPLFSDVGAPAYPCPLESGHVTHHIAIMSVVEVSLLACLGFNGTFSTNRLYRAITVGYYIT